MMKIFKNRKEGQLPPDLVVVISFWPQERQVWLELNPGSLFIERR